MPHEEYMKLAIKLAKKGRGSTNPNPMVGSVIVKNDKILATGFHKRAGLPHAEIAALNRAGERARGAILYVNLEPCRHYGRTSPCTKTIIQAGIKEVYCAMPDPNPLNNGKGIEELRKNGVRVKVGILEEESRKLNEVFIKFITQRMPFVTVKVAQSLDGKITTRTGESKWISSKNSRLLGKRLRSEVDAIVVGVDTIIKDNPLLNRKPLTANRKPHKIYYKIILDSKLRISPKARIFSKESLGKVILATTKYAPRSKVDLFSRKAEVLICQDRNKQVDLRDLMKKLAQKEISHVLIEGGGESIASALEAKIADKILFFISPKIIGGRDAVTSVEGEGIERLSRAIRIKDAKVRRIGEDVLVEGYL
jgi:diaminohydroxyphosphoribosylaminopyrimidine deaminase/5-amino-6-(5-phosphoribosylamino)uracil reductase